MNSHGATWLCSLFIEQAEDLLSLTLGLFLLWSLYILCMFMSELQGDMCMGGVLIHIGHKLVLLSSKHFCLGSLFRLVLRLSVTTT